MKSMKKQAAWFHGSPLDLKILRKGSSITQIEEIARVFATKPGIVSVSDNGKIKHDGISKGRVYRVTDNVTAADIHEHPRSSMEGGWEWITKKAFKLEFLYEVSPSLDDLLSEEENVELRKLHERA
jgi:hypothetical protein